MGDNEKNLIVCCLCTENEISKTVGENRGINYEIQVDCGKIQLD